MLSSFYGIWYDVVFYAILLFIVELYIIPNNSTMYHVQCIPKFTLIANYRRGRDYNNRLCNVLIILCNVIVCNIPSNSKLNTYVMFCACYDVSLDFFLDIDLVSIVFLGCLTPVTFNSRSCSNA